MAWSYPYLAQAAVAVAVGVAANALTPDTKIEGPKIGDLKIQSSEYGRFLPIIYGTMKTAGSVIWIENNELKETSHEEDVGGKGGPSVVSTTYTYSASFAVALAGVELSTVTRIWADTKLIYDASTTDAGTIWVSSELASSILFHDGSSDQPVSARMQADKPDAPAYRGVSYVEFHDFQLADFGNRIPNLTFEVVAEPQAIDFKRKIGEYSASDVDWDGLYPTVMNDGVLRTRRYNGAGNVNLFDLNGNFLGMQSPDAIIDKIPPVGSQGLLKNGSVQVTTRNNPASVIWTSPEGDFSLDLLSDAGVVGALFTIAFAPKNEVMIALLSAPLDTPDIESGFKGDAAFWYLLTVDNGRSVIVDQGTCSGMTNLSQYAFGYSNGAGGNPLNHYTANTLESDLRHLWVASGSGAGEVKLYEINDNNVMSSLGSSVFATQPYFSFTKPCLYADNMILIVISKASSTGGWISYYSRELDGTVQSSQLSSIVSSLCDNAGLSYSDIDATALSDSVEGFAITNLSSLKSALDPLQLTYQFEPLESEYKIKFVKRGGDAIATLTENDLAAHEYGQERPSVLSHERGKEIGLPRRFELGYIDKVRDYDAGRQYASRLTTTSEHVVSVDVPIVISDAKAAQVCEIALYVAWDGRNSYELTVPYQYVRFEPTDIIEVNLESVTHRIRLTEVTAGKPGIIELRGVSDTAFSYTSIAAGEGGGAADSIISISGPTNLVLLDVPLLRGQDNDSGLYAAAGGYYSGWSGAVLLKSSDGGESYVQTQALLSESTMGSTTNVLASGSTKVIDRTNTVNVRVNNGKQLSSITEAALLAGGNAAAIGQNGRWEIIGFQTATLEADGTYTLSNMIRGYKGTDNNTGNHATADVFVLLSAASLARTSANDDEIGSQRHYRGVTIGKNQFSALELPFTNTAQSLKPYSPVDIAATRNGSNDIAVTWTRRTRIGGEWRDSVGAQLGETTENYEIDIMSGSTVKRTITGITTPTYTYTATDQTTDFGSTQSSVTVRIYQISATVGRGQKGEATV